VNAEITCLLECSVFGRNVENIRNNKLITMNLLFRSCCFFLARCNK